MRIVRFEDLEAWKEARVLVSQVYAAVGKTKDLRRDYRFCDQITAAAVSVMSNIAEGFSRRSNREFIQFLFIAKGSCGEVQSLLYVALDQQYLTMPEFQELYAQAETVAKITSGLITYLLHKPNKPNEPKNPNEPNQLNKPNKLD